MLVAVSEGVVPDDGLVVPEDPSGEAGSSVTESATGSADTRSTSAPRALSSSDAEFQSEGLSMSTVCGISPGARSPTRSLCDTERALCKTITARASPTPHAALGVRVRGQSLP